MLLRAQHSPRPTEQLCDFVCNCSDCSDENQCGYLWSSAVLGTPFTCDFEEGDCGWQDVSTSTYRWVRGQASLAMWGMGPYSDHTVGTNLGWFMVTVSPPAKTMATAWLRSPVMREAATTCEISAWFHLSGSVLRLAMMYRDEVVGLWQSPERRGEGWHQLVAYPGRVAEQFQVSMCWGPHGADQMLMPCPTTPEPRQQECGVEESSCNRGSCLAKHRFCDGTDDCGDGSDENTTQCGEHLWAWGGGPARHLSLGTMYGIPTRDHSLNSRTGTLLDTGIPGGCVPLPRVLGLTHSPSSPQLVLYCHLHGSATSSLSISYVINSTKYLVRERMGDLGSSWVRERVDFNVTKQFKVGWGQGTQGTCCAGASPTPPPTPTPSSQVRLFPPQRRCLLVPSHCRGSQGAGTPCSHSAGCGWVPLWEVGGDARAGCWAGGAARDTEPLPRPLRVFLCPGAFLALQAGEGQVMAAAKARTPLLGPSGPACAMEMSYHIHSGLQGNAPLSPGVSCPLPVPCCQAPWGSPPPCDPQVELLGLVDLQDSGKGHFGDLSAFGVPYLHSLTTVTPLWPELSCNFERGMCGWYQDQSSDFKWVRVTGQRQGSDHTTGSGYFLAVDPSAPWSRGQRAQLITYHQEPATALRCLSFWYRLAGPQIGTLNLKMQLEGGEETVIWTQRGTQGSIWHQGQVTLPTTGQRQYRLSFEALRDAFLGDVSLDDLALRAGPCGAELSCSFEADACGLAASEQHTWLRQSNGTGTTRGPSADHTTGTATGHYMVVSTGRVSLPVGRTAVLTSQPYQPSAPTQCLAFWYQLSTGTPGSLGVFMEESGVRRKVMSVSAMEGDTWHLGHVTVQPDGDWQAIFEAVGAGGSHGYIALDDLHVSDGACPKPASCDFERDMCGWTSLSDPRLHSFAWGWKSGVPLAKYPGPEQDHTLGTRDGHYMHFDTSVLGPGGTTARLESQHLPAAADSCLQFWYHMDIPEHLSRGELRVRLQSVAGQRTVWSMAGHRSQGWQGGVVPVQSPSEFQIIFEITTRRWPMVGTVALDDIVLAASLLPAEKSSGSFVAEVVLGLLLAIIIVALVAAGGWYWLKPRGPASRTSAESNAPQGFDNITFRDVRTQGGRALLLLQPHQNSIFLKAQQIPSGSP
uniref:MAM domain containing 4 n=1 Tax=Calidris pygmaea TaxID=425635 RepID=A0A8C3JDD9_9CHAR